VPVTDLPAIVAAMVLLAVASRSLQSRGFAVASRRVQRLCPTRPPNARVPDGARVARVVETIGRAAELIPGQVGCLPRSMTISAMLRHRGVEADLRIGVRSTSAGVEAHAWVELDGVPVNDASNVDDEFLPFDREITNAIASLMR
jgi:hypothetical protein